MKHIVQYSGGAGSAMAAYLVTQKQPKEDIILLFHDVKGGHDEDMYRFNADVSEFLGLPITEYSLQKTIWEVIKEQKSTPAYPWRPYCTRIFKLEIADSFYFDLPRFAYHYDNPQAEELALYPDVPFILYTGYCSGEERRVAKKSSIAKSTKYPVFDAGLTSDDCKRIISQEWGIKLPKPYLLGFEHNNCIPCWKSTSKDYWRLVWQHYPERYQKAIEMEEYTGHTHFKDVSLKELAKQWEAISMAKTCVMCAYWQHESKIQNIIRHGGKCKLNDKETRMEESCLVGRR
mgnify:CR=1 FL=1